MKTFSIFRVDTEAGFFCAESDWGPVLRASKLTELMDVTFGLRSGNMKCCGNNYLIR